MILTQKFYERSPLKVAPEILGKVLVRNISGQIISGRIVEVEAYIAFIDEAAHSFRGKTKANYPLFGKAGVAYVHSIHMQQCLDIVTEVEDVPGSVLIRALEPLEGIELMKQHRGKENLKDLTTGPGKLCKALSITKEFNGVDVTNKESGLYFLDDGVSIPPKDLVVTKRIGLSKAADFEYRFCIKTSSYLSKRVS
ncbi:MAG: DNA-3-methyladenine glycosylase [Candidatus Dojkabacteria bacterium]|nr:MAG: DNA-3-methyladenine glycosylase [Candidatus Dojkabacteria bacterium]